MASNISLTGPLEYLDTIEVGVAATSVSFGASGDGITQKVLNGDLDETYIVEWYIPAGTDALYSLEPNGTSADQKTGQLFGGSASGDAAFASLGFHITGAATRVGGGSFEFQAKSGKVRILNGTGWNGNPSTISSSDNFAFSVCGAWNDLAEVVTSLDIVSSVASGIPAGAVFTLYRRRAVNGDLATNVVAQTTLAVDATSMTLPALNGDADEEYEITFDLILPVGSGNIQIEINGGTPGTSSEINNGGTFTEYADWRLLEYAGLGGTAQYYSGSIRMRASRTVGGVARPIQYWFEGHRQSDQPLIVTMLGVGFVTGLAANLTSLEFVHSVASGLKAGSQITVRRVST